MSDIPHPPIATRDAWEQARQALLVAEKELTRQRDRVTAARRRLPMVPIANYLFDGAQGEVRFVDLFAGGSCATTSSINCVGIVSKSEPMSD